MVGGNGRETPQEQAGSARAVGAGVARCKRCFRWKPAAAFEGMGGRVCVTCDECRAYQQEWYQARRRQEEESEGWEPGWEECLRCEVRPDCDESDSRCGRRRVLERMRAGEIEASRLMVPLGYVSVPELAAELGVVRNSLYGRIERGTLAAERWRIGNRVRWLVPSEAGD